MAPERDLLDWLTLGATISTGLVLALAALLAYAVQRARYLREIQPDLRLTGQPSTSELDPTHPRFLVRISVENSSPLNTAESIAISGALTFEPMPAPITSQTEISRLLPGHEQNVTLVFERNLEINFDGMLGEDLDAELILQVQFSPPREFVLFLLHPWSFGRKTYTRAIIVNWLWHGWADADRFGWNSGDFDVHYP